MDITKAFTVLQQLEGGDKVTNITGDLGGLTKYGISQASHPGLDIANLTADQAQAIYQTQYWHTAGCDQLKPDLQYIHFDTAVNMGVGMAIKLLQKASGVAEDGVLGPNTINASNTISAEAYLLTRLMHYNAIIANDANQYKFCRGWTNRIATLFGMSRNGELI